MSDTRSDDTDQRDLMAALGHAIMDWASVELHLTLLFRSLLDDSREVADLLWSRVRSFEAKLLMLHDLAAAKLPSPEAKRDWSLLREHITALYRKRNQLAHSSLVMQDDDKVALEPFFSLTQPPSIVLRKPEVDAYADEFLALSDAINNFYLVVKAALRHQESPTQESDLLRRLRTKDDRKREAQRHRSLALRQYRERNPDLDLE